MMVRVKPVCLMGSLTAPGSMGFQTVQQSAALMMSMVLFTMGSLMLRRGVMGQEGLCLLAGMRMKVNLRMICQMEMEWLNVHLVNSLRDNFAAGSDVDAVRCFLQTAVYIVENGRQMLSTVVGHVLMQMVKCMKGNGNLE